MTLGIMQPYFFPYVGYFSLIKATDSWVVFDTAQYIRHGWINRNRILKPDNGWQYINVPLKKHHRGTPINETRISNHIDWKDRILNQLVHYKKRAPYYNQVIDLLKDCFEFEGDNMSDFNTHCLLKTCDYLGLELNIHIFSRMDQCSKDLMAPGDWALEISKKLNATEYYNPISGREIFDREKFTRAGIKLNFLTSKLQPYKQLRSEFEPGLSIIDLMMFNSQESIHDHINQYGLE